LAKQLVSVSRWKGRTANKTKAKQGRKKHKCICVRTHSVDLCQEWGLFTTKVHQNYCAVWNLVVSLQRQKV